MKNLLEKKIKLEVLRTKIFVNQETTENKLWLTSEFPHMHKHYLKELKNDKETYIQTLRPLLVPNKKYVMDLSNYIRTCEDGTSIIPFLHENMVYGEYKNEHDDYFYDKSTPFATHKFCEFGESMEDNKAEIIESLYVSEWTFFVDDDGNTIINGRIEDWNDTKINVKVAKNIFDTDLILNISLFTI